MPAVHAALALFEKIMRELWLAGPLGGALGGLAVALVLGFVVVCTFAAYVHLYPPGLVAKRRPRRRKRRGASGADNAS